VSEEHASSVYANALFAAARDTKHVGRVRQEFYDFAQAFSAMPELRHALLDPQIDGAAKRAVLTGVIEDASPLLANVLCLLLEKGRLALVPEIAVRYEQLAERAADLVEVRVKSAVPLPAATQDELRARLEKMTGREVRVIDCVDPAIVGGLSLHVGDDVLVDASVQTRIEQLRDRLSGASTKGASQ
jgi:F-type H+-transporting ATPase subunit delta